MKITINNLDDLEKFIETAPLSKEQLLYVYQQATQNLGSFYVQLIPPNDDTSAEGKDTKETIIEKIKLSINGHRTGQLYIFMYGFKRDVPVDDDL